MSLNIYTAGNKAKASEVNSNFNTIFKLRNEQAILDRSKEITVSDQKIIDIFSAAAGANTTVDTTNTTARFFDTNRYECALPLSTIILEPSFETITNWSYSETDANFTGAQSTTHPTEATYDYKLGSNSANAKIATTYGQIAQSVDFTNIHFIYFDYYKDSFLTSVGGHGAKFEVLLDTTIIYADTTGGASAKYNNYIDVSGYTGTKSLIFRVTSQGVNVTWTGSVYIDNIRTSYQDTYIQSDTTTISTSDDKIFCTPLMHEALSGSDALTFDYSMDNEANWETGNAVNTWIDASSATNSGTLSIKLQLDTDDGSTTPKISGWCTITSD